MRIDKIHIDSFMGKRDLTLTFSRGVNILRGDNESGKSTLAEFIKFMLYGASARNADGAIPERQRYLSFGDTSFGGYMELVTASGHYRIDRTIHRTQSGFRESLSISDLDKKTQVCKGENAGEALLGIPEQVFKKIAYISQEGEGYTGGSDLGAAIENLLFSADETVSTDKALKSLDALRVSLRHKDGKGGQHCDMENEREALKARLEKALSDNSEIIAKEGSLLETQRRIAENKTEYSRSRKLCELYDNYIAHTRFARLDETITEENALAEETEALEKTFDGFAPDGEYLGRLRQTAEQMRAADLQVRAAKDKAENAARARAAAEEAVTEEGDTQALQESAAKVSGAQKATKVLTALGVLLLAAAAICFCAAYLMRLDSLWYAVAAGGALLGALPVALGIGKRKRTDRLLRSFGATSAYELLEKVQETKESAVRKQEAFARARETESAANALLATEKKRLEALKEALHTEAARLHGDGGDPDALFSAVEQYIAQSEALSSKAALLADRKKQLRSETAAYDRASVEEMLSAVGDLTVFEKLDITEYSRKRDFCENAIAALEIKRGDLEKSLAALHATVENPALLRAALDALGKKESAAKAKYAAAELAMRSIENASAGLRTRVSPRLADYAGKLMAVMTDGKYSELGVDGAIRLSYLSEGGAHDAAYLSKGTRESAYFALRLALADLLCKEEKLPLILDESFAHTDDQRTKQMLRILMALASEDTQSFVLTCHTREEKIADAVGVYNLIEMQSAPAAKR